MSTRRSNYTGVLLRPQPGGRHVLGSELCIDGAICPGCQRSLVCFGLIDLSDPVLDWPGCAWQRLPLLQCPYCDVFLSELEYYLRSSGAVQVAMPAVTSAAASAWSPQEWRRLFASGRPQELVCIARPIPAAVQDIIDAANAGADLPDSDIALLASYTGSRADQDVGGYPYLDVANQIGGQPYAPQGLCARGCDTCTDAPVLWATLANERWRGVRLLFDDAYLLFEVCLQCGRVVASQFAR